MPLALRTIALTALALSACVPSVIVGDNPQDETATATLTTPDDTTTDAASSGDAPTEPTEAPGPGVCGDGVVDPDEACDDANDEPHDGCDAQCTRTGEVAWTVERAGELSGFAVAPDGTSYASGRDVEAFLTAFGPNGAELWSRTVPSAGELAVGDGGQIFLLTATHGIHAFAPDATPLWDVNLDPGSGLHGIFGLAAASDALYVGRYVKDSQEQIVVRRHDLATGDLEWETPTPPEVKLSAADLALAGDRIFVAGRILAEGPKVLPLLAVLDTAGELLSLELDDPVSRTWMAVAGVDGSELVIAGRGADDPRFVVRRLDGQLDEVWTDAATDAPGSEPRRLVAGPGERIAAVGVDNSLGAAAVVRLYDGAGALEWSSVFPSPAPGHQDHAIGAGFGPDALVVGGTAFTANEEQSTFSYWVRGFALD